MDHTLDYMPTSDSAGDMHSEYGGAAAEWPAHPASGPAAAAAAAPDLADPMVNPIGLSRAEENAMRSDSAAVGGGLLAGRTAAAQRASGAFRRHGKQGAAPGRKPSSPAVSDAATASGALRPATAEPEQRRSRLSAGTVAPAGASASFAERFLQRFRDPALERRFRMSQAALLRPVRL